MTPTRIRAAVVDDAPALGQVMVESWLSAHRGQVPDVVWHKRVDDWTPQVSAEAWTRHFARQAEDGSSGDVLLIAEDEGGPVIGLVLGTTADEDAGRTLAEIVCLYVLPDRHGEGVGRALVCAVAGELAERGFTSLHVCVLTANLPARGFYEAMGGREYDRRTVDEDGYVLPGTVYAWRDIAALTVSK